MKHCILLLFFLCCGFLSFSQQKQAKKPLSSIAHAGKYTYGRDIEKGRVGLAYIHAETDSTILFYLDLNRGAPSYNMGSIYGRVVIKNGKGIFKASLEGYQKACELLFQFTANKLSIETVSDNDDCGVGFGVLADGIFKRTTTINPAYFLDATGAKRYFKELDLR
ncbi:hypothetical protein BH11BAC4_BH11BAC4_17290 [soil metagenome]